MLSRRYLMSFSVHSFTRPFNMDQVTISISNRYNRSVHPDPTYELQKAQNWTQLQREMPRLFNASKFRLHKLYEDDAPSRSLHMEWGLTDYASYLGMCCSSERSSQLLKEGEKLQRNPFAFLSRKIGVAAVLETNDGHIVLIKRSKNVGLYQELYDTPGGHPEPCHILLTEEALETGNERLKAHFKDATKHEFFQSIRNEVYEEINISLQQQHPPKLMGVVYQTDACTPSFAFYIKTNCSAKELKELYRAGPRDQFESTKLKLLPAESLLAQGSSLLVDLKLTPSAKGALGMYVWHCKHAHLH